MHPKSYGAIQAFLSNKCPALLCKLALGCLTIAVIGHPQQARSAEPETLAIVGVTIIDPGRDEPIENATVIIAGDRIITIGKADTIEVPADSKIVDGRGKFLTPGLADMHVHLEAFGGAGLAMLVANGVTLVRDMGGDIGQLQAMRDRVASGQVIGPRMLTVGPVFESRRWMLAVREIFEYPLRFKAPYSSAIEAAELVQLFRSLGHDFIKTRNVPSASAYRGLAAAATAIGQGVVGHEPGRLPLSEVSLIPLSEVNPPILGHIA